jgi:hypothetical protein
MKKHLRLCAVLVLSLTVLACGLTVPAANVQSTASPLPPTSTVTNLPPTQTPVPATPTLEQPAFTLDLSARPLAWFAPLPPMPTHPGREFTGSDDFMQLFEPEAAWAEAAGHIQVFKLYGEWVAYHATDEQLRQVVEELNRRGLALAVEAGPLDPPAECGTGVEGFAGVEEGLNIARRIAAAGGSIHLLALDEPYFFAHVYDGPNACHWPVEKIAEEVGKYIQAMQAAMPGVMVGDTEPLTGAAGAQAYRDWLDLFFQVNGYPLAFLHMDIDWSRPQWMQEVLEIENYGRQIGVPVGLIYGGNGFDKTDEDWLSAAGERVKKYELNAGGQPEHVLFQSWNDKPDAVLPESQPFTFTNFINLYFSDKTALGFRREGLGANLALGKSVTVSSQLPDQTAELAVDGDLGTLWNSGGGPPQWIEIDLGAAFNIQEIRLVPSQYPAGPTTHQVLGKGPDAGDQFTLIFIFDGSTEDGQALVFTPPQPVQGIQYIRVETSTSPSWVAWREIVVVQGD